MSEKDFLSLLNLVLFVYSQRDETEKQTKQHFKIPANTTPVGFAAISSANQKTSPVQDGSIDLGSACLYSR